ncbi:MAG: serine hydrolase, partial [Bacillota bacterium]
HHPRLDGMTYGFIENAVNGERVIGHGGNTFLFNTGLYLLPEHRIGLFVSYSGGVGTEREVLFQAFMDRYYPAPQMTELEPPSGSVERAADYVGEYHPNRSSFTTAERLLSLMQASRISVTEDGHLVANMYGETMQFIEVEPGVYRNRMTDGAQIVSTLVFDTDVGGRTMLFHDGSLNPMTQSRAPWYGTGRLAGMLVTSALLMLSGTAVGWTTAPAARLLRGHREPVHWPTFAARASAGLLAAAALVLLVGLVVEFGDIHPAYGVPRVVLGDVDRLQRLLMIPPVMALLNGVTVVFSVLAWHRGYWTAAARVHYTLVTLSGLGLIWVLRLGRLL